MGPAWLTDHMPRAGGGRPATSTVLSILFTALSRSYFPGTPSSRLAWPSASQGRPSKCRLWSSCYKRRCSVSTGDSTWTARSGSAGSSGGSSDGQEVDWPSPSEKGRLGRSGHGLANVPPPSHPLHPAGVICLWAPGVFTGDPVPLCGRMPEVFPGDAAPGGR